MYINRFIIIATIVLFSACSQGKAENNNIAVKNVSATEFATIIRDGKGQLIDIRTPGEFNAGHIKGAKMIDFYAPDFREKLAGLDKKQPVYVYCRSGNRSGQAVRILQGMGFKEVVNLQRGINDWVSSGLNLVK